MIWTDTGQEFKPFHDPDLDCWNCVHPFEWDCCPMPVGMNVRLGQIKVLGYFCGASCMIRYVIDHVRWNYVLRSGWLSRALLMLGIHWPVHAAPTREHLYNFGGGMSIKKYRETAVKGKLKPLPYRLIAEPPQSVMPAAFIEPEPQKRKAGNIETMLGIKRLKK